jgi:hypothetical protein
MKKGGLRGLCYEFGGKINPKSQKSPSSFVTLHPLPWNYPLPELA